MKLEELQGEVTRVRVIGEDFWGILDVRPPKGGVVRGVGKILGAQVGDTVKLRGVWTRHPKFGEQFKFRELDTLVPQDDSGIVAWLASQVPHFGPKRAAALVEELGANGVWDVIENSPDQLLEVAGITEQRRDEIVEAYWKHRADRDRMVALKSYGLTDAQIAAIVETWGSDALAKIRANPYQMIEFVRGFGFKRADMVALRMGLPAQSSARMRAGLVHMLTEAAESHGHAYVPSGKLVKMTSRLLEVPEGEIANELNLMIVKRSVIGKGTRVALPELDRAETEIADRLAQAIRGAA